MSLYRLAIYRLAMRLMRHAFGSITPTLQPAYVYAAQVAMGSMFGADDTDDADIIDADEILQTINGPVAVRDIPLDADGRPDTAWVIANCPCPEHELARLIRDAAV